MKTKRLTTILLSIMIALSFMPGYAFAVGESSDVNDQDLTEATEGAEVQEATALVQEDSANNNEDKASDVTKGDTRGTRGGAEIIDSGTCGDNLTWTLDSDGLLTISGEGKLYNYSYSSSYRDSITEVIIENGVTSIGAFAFHDCSSLTSITIPESVTSIEKYAFNFCSSLTSVTIPNSVTSIKEGLFDGCSSLTSATIPDSVTSIGRIAFQGCSRLTSITIPESVTSIGNAAFYDCSSLTSITIPEGVTSIADNTFVGCSSLTSITIPESVTSIGEWAFGDCSSLKYIFYKGTEQQWSNISKTNSNLRGTVHYSATDHTYGEWSIKKEATCTEAGSKEKPCIVCEYAMTEEIPIDPEAHAWGEWADCGDGNNHQRVCSYSDEHVDTKAHEWNNGEITTPATCIEAGIKTFTCTACGATKTEEVDPTGEHIFGEWTTSQPATCTATGIRVRECTVCHETKTETIPIDPEAHDWDEPEWTWAEDHSSASAKFVCKNDSTHVESIDAEVTIAVDDTGNNNVYAAKATIDDKEYTETFTEEKIKRIYGASRYDTAIKVADEYKAATGSKFENVVVAYGKNFPDALSGGYLAKVKNAPILLVEPKQEDRIADYISENIADGGTVYILGGTGAVSSEFESKVEAKGITPVRLGGATRYETNLEILKEAEVDSEDILVCTGTGYADSLSASAVGKPILLVGKTLTDEQKTYIESLNSNQFYLIGGTGAVNTSIEKGLKNLGYNVERLSGASRYETSTEVAKKFFPEAKTVVLAYAKNFPDGLSGGPLAMKKSAPIILTDSSKTEAAAEYVKETGAVSSITLGGSSLISDIAVTAIMGS